MKNLFFLFFLTPMFVFAQQSIPEIIINQGRIIDLDEDDGVLVVYSKDCDPYTKIRVYLTNLVKIDGGFGIPPGLQSPEPPEGAALFLKYQIGSLVGQQEFDNTFIYSFSINENLKVYYKEFEIPLNNNDVFSSCTSGTSVSGEFKIINAIGNPLPLFYYGNSGNIFDCNYFSIIDCNCTIPQSCLENGSEIVWDDAYLNEFDFCEECGLQHDGIIYRNNNLDSDAIFFPNPFIENAKIELDITEESTIEVVIFDASGKIISSWEENVNIGNYSKVLNTSNWQNGIYFGKIKIGSNTKSIRMVKME